jgi:hypothetical protein
MGCWEYGNEHLASIKDDSHPLKRDCGLLGVFFWCVPGERGRTTLSLCYDTWVRAGFRPSTPAFHMEACYRHLNQPRTYINNTFSARAFAVEMLSGVNLKFCVKSKRITAFKRFNVCQS